MKIEVTDNDIKNGKTKNIRNCPVALALRRELELEDVYVMGSYVLINERHYRLPREVEKFISDFDLLEKVEPFLFELEEA